MLVVDPRKIIVYSDQNTKAIVILIKTCTVAFVNAVSFCLKNACMRKVGVGTVVA